MVRYRITHTTQYEYEEPIGLCQNIAKLTPRSFPGQTCLSSEMVIHPEPDVMNRYLDFFGNHVAYYAIEQEHQQLTVTVQSEVALDPPAFTGANYPSLAWEQVRDQMALAHADNLEVRQFVPETHMTRIDPEVRAYARKSFLPGRPLFEAAYDLMQSIFRDFEFKPGLTTITTPVQAVMALRKGVCQDFAHVAISCMRAMGLPARYISGYIETLPLPGKEKLVGSDASHAWLSVFIPNMGWVDFDPTNNQMASQQHITIGWGRDYADVAPLKGIILSSRPHKLKVSVDVHRLTENQTLTSEDQSVLTA